MICAILFIVTSAGYPNDIPVSMWLSSAEVAHAGRVYFRGDTMFVYQARNNINGKCYVGKTVRTIEQRRKAHEERATHVSGIVFHSALRKYGFDAFEWKVLMECDDEDDLNESEIACIKMLKTRAPNGYNLTDGGTGGDTFSGRTHTLKTRKLIGDIHRGMKHSEEAKEKIRAARLGTKWTAEQKAKASAMRSTPEARAANSKRQLGKRYIIKHTEEALVKMRAAAAKRKRQSGRFACENKTV